MRRAGRLVATIAGVTIALAVLASSASALSGSITGVTVDPSLASASVQNLSATYDRCATEQAPELTCSWYSMALLFPPLVNSCPTSEPLPPPPGLPAPPGEPPILTVWSQAAGADGTLHSGPRSFPLEGWNDRWLCLYLNRSVYSSGVTTSGSAHTSYTAPTMASDLLAAQLLHVNQLVESLPPDTKIFKSVLRRRPPIFVFHFQSTEPGSTFRCKLDRHPFATCPSSQRFGHLKPGRHKLEVAAVDAAGNEDPTPAVARFKVPTPLHKHRKS